MDEVEASRRRLKLLCETDRLLGVQDWPVSRACISPAKMVVASTEDSPAMSKKAPQPSARPPQAEVAPRPARNPDDPGLMARLRAVLEQFPPELPEPPGAEPDSRPDAMRSALYALKGSPVEEVNRKVKALARQAQQVKQCEQCGLDKTCTQKVFGIGHPDTRIVFVGEAPGADEDRMGYPFVGRAGKLLTAMIEKGMGLRREQVYICNVVKCRPPENRTPTIEEMAACQVHLWAQLSVIEPEYVVALGAPATQTLLNTKASLGSQRGRFYEISLSGSREASGPKAKCIVTYHPAYLLRNPPDKKKAWDDLKRLMAEIGIPGSE